MTSSAKNGLLAASTSARASCRRLYKKPSSLFFSSTFCSSRFISSLAHRLTFLSWPATPSTAPSLLLTSANVYTGSASNLRVSFLYSASSASSSRLAKQHKYDISAHLLLLLPHQQVHRKSLHRPSHLPVNCSSTYGATYFRSALLPPQQQLLRKRMEVVMQARYCQCNYATNASDTQTRFSSEGQTQKSYKSKLEYPTAAGVPLDNKGLDCAQSIGRRISPVEKKKFLVNTLFDLKDTKEVVYGTLDAWVAWEQNFPLPLVRRALLVLEKEEQWHRIVQVIKWMLCKGQGTTMGTYEQLIRALEKDNRPEEAHNIWVKKVSYNLQSVPWQFCDLMLSIYYRNNMLERLVKLFKDIESFGRRPPRKSIVRKVVDAYELLGSSEEKNRVLQRYEDLFNSSPTESSGKLRKFSKRTDKKKHRRKAAIDKSAKKSTSLDSGVPEVEK